MATKHTVSAGESLLSIANHYGFGSTQPLEDHADNQALLAERGEDGLHPGDVLTVPDGRTGEALRGTGRGHQFTVNQIQRWLEIRVYTELQKEDPSNAGTKAVDPDGTWKPFVVNGKARGITEIKAAVEFKQLSGMYVAGKVPPGVTNAKTGIFRTQGLWDGKWQVKLTPAQDQLSSGPARANPGVDHGLGFYETAGRAATRDADGKRVPPPLKPSPTNKCFEVEYRELELELEVVDGQIASASFAGAPAISRPHHAVLLWKNVGATKDLQVLEIDWKPDFMRRVVKKLGPRHRERNTDIEIIMFHHTAGMSIGPALYTFLAPGVSQKSGAHFLVDVDGHVIRLADDRYETRHGGGGQDIRPPSWQGRTTPRINRRAVGIEHVHTDVELSPDRLVIGTKYTSAQYDASADLIRSLKRAYGVSAADVIGHQDVVCKSMCPGRMVDWEMLGNAGVSLAPAPLTAAELDDMFGGFYAGAAGRQRQLLLGSKEVEVDTKFEVSDAKGNVLATGLAAGPISTFRESVRQIGYSVNNSIVIKGTTYSLTVAKAPVFEETLGYALSQLIRHYCTMGRARHDMYMCYREIPRVWSKLFVDFELAKLVRGLEKAAIAARGGPL